MNGRVNRGFVGMKLIVREMSCCCLYYPIVDSLSQASGNQTRRHANRSM